ncbi:MAG: hypothetical protein ACRCZJ_02235 [Erysipelotrichaceae bacterium]
MNPIIRSVFRNYILNKRHTYLKKKDLLVLLSLMDTCYEADILSLFPSDFGAKKHLKKLENQKKIKRMLQDDRYVVKLTTKGASQLKHHILNTSVALISHMDETQAASYVAQMEVLNMQLEDKYINHLEHVVKLPKRCPKCSNHCKVNHLRCKKGERFFAELQGSKE